MQEIVVALAEGLAVLADGLVWDGWVAEVAVAVDGGGGVGAEVEEGAVGRGAAKARSSSPPEMTNKRATATATTGVLRCAQDDGQWSG